MSKNVAAPQTGIFESLLALFPTNPPATYGVVRHPREYIRVVSEVASMLPTPYDPVKFASQFVNKSGRYTNTPGGLAAIKVTAAVYDKVSDLLPIFVESVLGDEEDTFTVVFRGAIKPSDLDKLTEAVRGICSLTVIVKAGDRAESTNETSELTILQGKAIVAEKAKSANLLAGAIVKPGEISGPLTVNPNAPLLPATEADYREVVEQGGVPFSLFKTVIGVNAVDFEKALDVRQDGMLVYNDVNGVPWTSKLGNGRWTPDPVLLAESNIGEAKKKSGKLPGWRTTDTGAKIYIDKGGSVTKGNPYLMAAIGKKSAAGRKPQIKALLKRGIAAHKKIENAANTITASKARVEALKAQLKDSQRKGYGHFPDETAHVSDAQAVKHLSKLPLKELRKRQGINDAAMKSWSSQWGHTLKTKKIPDRDRAYDEIERRRRHLQAAVYKSTDESYHETVVPGPDGASFMLGTKEEVIAWVKSGYNTWNIAPSDNQTINVSTKDGTYAIKGSIDEAIALINKISDVYDNDSECDMMIEGYLREFAEGQGERVSDDAPEGEFRDERDQQVSAITRVRADLVEQFGLRSRLPKRRRRRTIKNTAGMNATRSVMNPLTNRSRRSSKSFMSRLREEEEQTDEDFAALLKRKAKHFKKKLRIATANVLSRDRLNKDNRALKHGLALNRATARHKYSESSQTVNDEPRPADIALWMEIKEAASIKFDDVTSEEARTWIGRQYDERDGRWTTERVAAPDDTITLYVTVPSKSKLDESAQKSIVRIIYDNNGIVPKSNQFRTMGNYFGGTFYFENGKDATTAMNAVRSAVPGVKLRLDPEDAFTVTNESASNIIVNLTPKKVEELNLSLLDVSPVIDNNSGKTVGNIYIPGEKSFKQRQAILKKRFGENAVFGAQGKSYADAVRLIFAWQNEDDTMSEEEIAEAKRKASSVGKKIVKVEYAVPESFDDNGFFKWLKANAPSVRELYVNPKTGKGVLPNEAPGPHLLLQLEGNVSDVAKARKLVIKMVKDNLPADEFDGESNSKSAAVSDKTVYSKERIGDDELYGPPPKGISNAKWKEMLDDEVAKGMRSNKRGGYDQIKTPLTFNQHLRLSKDKLRKLHSGNSQSVKKSDDPNTHLDAATKRRKQISKYEVDTDPEYNRHMKAYSDALNKSYAVAHKERSKKSKAPTPKGGGWKTTDDGQHIYIGKGGKVKGKPSESIEDDSFVPMNEWEEGESFTLDTIDERERDEKKNPFSRDKNANQPEFEPMTRSYEQWIKRGNTFQPMGKAALKEGLERFAYKVSLDMTGTPVFTKVKPATDGLIRFESSIMDDVLKEIDSFWGLKESYDKIGVLHNRGILLFGPPGCHAVGTKILMFDGSLKNVEDVCIGDKLMGPDSNPRDVLILRRGQDEMFRIHPKKGKSFVVNGHHVLNMEFSGARETAHSAPKNITVNDYLASSAWMQEKLKLRKTGVDFKKSDRSGLFVDPYYLGVWLGDGMKKSAGVTTADKEIANAVSEYADSCGMQTVVRSKVRQCADHFIVGAKGTGRFKLLNTMTSRLRLIGVLNNKHIPANYLTSSREDRLLLLAGIIDTDGCYTHKTERDRDGRKGHYEVTQKSRQLASDIVRLASSLGFSVTERVCKKSIKSIGFVGEYVRINISGDIHNIPVRLPRKKATVGMPNKSCNRVGIRHIEPLGKGDYYGFTLSGDHLYLTDDFMVHHNSGKTIVLQQCVEMIVERGDPVLFATSVSAIKPALMALREIEPDRKVVVALEDSDNFVGYQEQEFLQLLDGGDAVPGVLYLGTTNYIDRFPKRLLRPGRFDKKVFVPGPTEAQRFTYLQHKLAKVDENDDMLRYMAKETAGMSFGHMKELITAVYALGEPVEDVLDRLKNDPSTDPAPASGGYRTMTGESIEGDIAESITSDQKKIAAMTREEFFNDPVLVRDVLTGGEEKGDYRVSYEYVNPGPAGPSKGSILLKSKPNKGDVISAMFGKARVTTVSKSKSKPPVMDNMEMFQGGKAFHKAAVEAERAAGIKLRPEVLADYGLKEAVNEVMSSMNNDPLWKTKPVSKLPPISEALRKAFGKATKHVIGRDAAGGMVVRKAADGTVECLLAKAPSKFGGGYLFPKGGVDKGEDTKIAAVREVKEEAGVDAKIIAGPVQVNGEEFGDRGKYDLDRAKAHVLQYAPEAASDSDFEKALPNASFMWKNNNNYFLMEWVGGEPRATGADDSGGGEWFPWSKVQLAKSERVKSVAKALTPALRAYAKSVGIKEESITEVSLGVTGDYTDSADKGAAKKLADFVIGSNNYVMQVARPVALYKKRGTYKEDQAYKLATHVVTAAGQHLGKGKDWHKTYGPATREMAQRLIVRQAEKDAAKGEYDETLPMKWQKDGDGEKK